ncbi:hypothetical protein DYB37_000116 [Aphanomyces astaci]|uniref:Protein Abitram n=1 Tax=Aphanomyces astaci TaxID=112090 RepID=A0A418EZD3_APHAT|nr:hypothetical protein DYB37_000116 [Aphanomyces astaci]
MEVSGSDTTAPTLVSVDEAKEVGHAEQNESIEKTDVFEKPLGKKRRRERRLALKKTQLCRHFDKPDGCPFPECRKLIRDQGEKRQADKFVHKDDATVVDYVARTGTMVRLPSFVDFNALTRYLGGPVGIAPGHCIFTRGLTVKSVEFEPSMVESKVTGKKKKGGVWLNPDTVVCRVTCSNGETFTFRSCIRGALIEINELLTPALLTTKPFTQGYIAIVRPKPVEIVEIQASLLPQQVYSELRHLTAASFR